METFLGAATVDITPLEPVYLFRSQQVTLDVDGDLEANILFMRQADGEPLCLVSIDTLFIGRLFKRGLLKLLGDQWQWPESKLVLVASHAHSAPILDDTKPHLCRLQPEYLDLVMRRVAEGVIAAINRARPLYMMYGSSLSELNVNRRKWSWGRSGIIPVRKVKTLPNVDGPVDKRLRIWKVAHAGGGAEAIIWNFACHPVGYPRTDRVHADYIGVVREALRREVGDVPILFIPGFMGDVRPPFYGMPETWREFLVWCVNFRVFARPGKKKYDEWTRKLSAIATQALLSAKDLEWTPLKFASSDLSLKIFLQNPVPGHLEVGVMTGIGSQVWALASAEVLTEYLPLIGPALGIKTDDVIPVSCVNQVFGYLPLDRHIKLGGYETTEFMPWFSLGGNEFFPHIEHYVIDTWADLHKEINKDDASSGGYSFLLKED